MPGESPEPRPRTKDPNTTVDSQVQQSVNVTSLGKSHKIAKRELRKGKWVKVVEDPPEQQLARYKEELQQGDEVIRKLKQQREKLDVQVKEVTTLVQEKVTESKEDEKKRIKKTMENIHHPNRRQFDQNLQKLTPEQVEVRLKELELEYKNARKQEQLLTKELEVVKVENEDRKVLDQITHLEDAIKNIDKDFVRLAGETKNNEKIKKENEKRIESIQSDRDDAQTINRLTQEVFHLKEKVKAFENKHSKEEAKYVDIENLIKEMDGKYQENYKLYVEKCKKEGVTDPPIKLVPLVQEYHELLQEKGKTAELERLRSKKGQKKGDKKEEKKKDDKEEKKDGEKGDSDEEKKKKEKEEKEKKEKEDKEKEDKEKKEKDDKQPKLPYYHKKLVKEIRKDQDNFQDLPVSLENFIRLELNHKKLQDFRKHQIKLFNKEVQALEDRLSDIQFDISSTQQYTREKEKEKELADTRFLELKRLLRKDQLESIDKEKLPKKKESTDPEAKVYKDLEEKKRKLKEKETQLMKHQHTEGKLPFSERIMKFSKKSSHKRLDKSIEDVEQTPLEMIKDCQFRLSVRSLYGKNPDKATQICDDVNVVGSLSIEHRIRKVQFYHNPEAGLIYGFQTEYIRGDKKSTVAGQWQINETMKKDKDTKQVLLEIASDDWINIMKGEINEEGFINYLKVTTKRGKTIEVGKSDGEEPTKENKDRHFEFKRVKGEVPITLFGGFNATGEAEEEGKEPQEVKEKPLALSCIGLESAEKMRIEEKILIESERKQIKDAKERKAREEKLRESKAFLPLIDEPQEEKKTKKDEKKVPK